MQAADLETAIAALQAQRALLGDAVADAAIAPLQARLAQLRAAQAPVAELAPLRQLRHLTVLFLDVVGSTALIQHLDAEDVSAVMDGLLARCTALVQRHGGQVLQYAGDSLLAAFGAERAREDDAERAVHCGLALLGEGRHLGESVQARFGHAGCQVRVGLHSGPVLLGGGVDEEGTIRGLTVNVAARMEQTAPAGALRISHDTWVQVRGLFDVLAQPPLQVKGRDAPMLTYLVQRARPRPFRLPTRGVEGLATPLVGRGAELQGLRATLDTVAAQGQPACATLTGEPGVGKSRLLHELLLQLDTHPARWWLLRARAHPQQQLQPYGLLRDLLAWRLQIADSDSAEAARRKLEDGLLPWLRSSTGEAEAQALIHRLGQLIGLDHSHSPHVKGCDPRRLRQDAFDALRRWWAALARDGTPLALLLEDLHWADDGSLDFVATLLAEPPALPLLLLATARDELLERRPAWGEGAPCHRRVALAPLAERDGEQLADALLQRLRGDPHHDAVRTLLLQRGQGNPFFMEELLRMLRDDGVIGDGDAVTGLGPGHWVVHGERLAAARLPGTLVGVLQARLDALPAADRLALQRASIIGPVFWDAALAALDTAAPHSLPALRARALVHARDESAFDGAHEDRFHHHLLQQVAYDTVLKPVRRAGHAAAAAWMAERVGDRSAEYLAVTAHHYERAGDDARAAEYLQRAAWAALSVDANPTALAYTTRALALAQEQVPARVRHALLRHRAAACDALGLRELQREALDAREAVCRELGDDTLLAETVWARALLHSRVGDEKGSLALALQAGTLARRAGAHAMAAMALGQAAWGLHASGRSDAGLVQAREALAAMRAVTPAPDTLLLAQLLTLAGEIGRAAGQYDRARADLDEALAAARRAGARRAEINATESLGHLAAAVGAHGDAEQLFLEQGRLAQAAALPRLGLFAGLNRARLLSSLERHDEALQALAEGEALAAADTPALRTSALLVRARACAAQGAQAAPADAAQADATFAEALAQADRSPDAALARQVRSEWALARLARAEPAELEAAQATLEPVLAHMQPVLAHGQPLLTHDAAAATTHGLDVLELWACHRVCQMRGDPRAGPLLRQAHTRLLQLAAPIGPPAQVRQFLHDKPVHRAIVAAAAASAID